MSYGAEHRARSQQILADLARVGTQLADVAATLARVAQNLATLGAEPPPVTIENFLPAYVDTKRAAQIMGVSVKTLEGFRMRGKGPTFVRIGRLIRYPMSELPKPKPAASKP